MFRDKLKIQIVKVYFGGEKYTCPAGYRHNTLETYMYTTKLSCQMNGTHGLWQNE